MIGKGDLSESRMSAEGEKSYRKKKGICALQQKMREQKDGNMRPPAEDERAGGREYASPSRRWEGAAGKCYMRWGVVSRREC